MSKIKMKTYDLRGVVVRASDVVDGVVIDPIQPDEFEATDNKERPSDHAVWWGVPFIKTYRPEKPSAEFLKEFPDGVRFDVRCLDGGAWDRSTWWGSFSTIAAAVAFAKEKPTYVFTAIAVIGEGNRPE